MTPYANTGAKHTLESETPSELEKFRPALDLDWADFHAIETLWYAHKPDQVQARQRIAVLFRAVRERGFEDGLTRGRVITEQITSLLRR